MNSDEEQMESLKQAAEGALARRRAAGAMEPVPTARVTVERVRTPGLFSVKVPTMRPRPTHCECGSAIEDPPPPRWGQCMACHRAAMRTKRDLAATYMLPPSFWWARFESPDLARRVTSGTAIATARLAQESRRIVFTGPAGSGKTSLAAALLRATYVSGDCDGFQFSPAYLLALARSRHKLGEGDPEELTAAIGTPLLVLDDLGMEKPGPTSVNDLEIVIYERHLRDRATWVTTWMGKAKIRERYGDGIARRLFEGSTVIDCGARP